MAEINLSNLQSILIKGYGLDYPISLFILMQFNGEDSGRTFLRKLSSLTSFGSDWLNAKPPYMVNVGLSYQGLKVIGVPPYDLSRLPREFVNGPEYRNGDLFKNSDESSQLSDYGLSDPAFWWEKQFNTDDIHCLVNTYGKNASDLEEINSIILQIANESEVTELKAKGNGTETLDGRILPERRLHFGYRDGITKPNFFWNDAESSDALVDFRRLIIGYATDRIYSLPNPNLQSDISAVTLFRDSSYCVLRWLQQDVAKFNTFLNTESAVLEETQPGVDKKELLAAKLMGRWRDGTPLVLSPSTPDSTLVETNDFLFQRDDPNALKCPFSAHIRVVNPRDQQTHFCDVPIIVRRGLPYGEEISPIDSTVDDGIDRGLVGLFFCSSINEQFNKLMGWMNRNDFSDVFNETFSLRQDPLFGNRSVKNSVHSFSINQSTGNVSIKNIPDFIRTKGTAFFIFPSKTCLQGIT